MATFRMVADKIKKSLINNPGAVLVGVTPTATGKTVRIFCFPMDASLDRTAKQILLGCYTPDIPAAWIEDDLRCVIATGELSNVEIDEAE